MRHRQPNPRMQSLKLSKQLRSLCHAPSIQIHQITHHLRLRKKPRFILMPMRRRKTKEEIVARIQQILANTRDLLEIDLQDAQSCIMIIRTQINTLLIIQHRPQFVEQ